MTGIVREMNLSRPLEVVSPAVDGDVLTVLAHAEGGFTGRAIHQRLPAGLRTVQLALDRLVRQGVVIRETVGNAHLYRLNDEHLATRSIVDLASLRLRLLAELRAQIDGWEIQAGAAALFGSAARGEMGADSDLDLLVVRPDSVDPDDELWRAQLTELARAATAWTGNDARIVEYGEEELTGNTSDSLLQEAAFEGVDLAGSLRSLVRRKHGRARR
jgi:predicted nucleotidyltransferase